MGFTIAALLCIFCIDAFLLFCYIASMQTERTNELTGPMARVEGRLGEPLGPWLRDRYERDGQTLAEIATQLGLNPVTIARWLRHFGVELRFPGQRGKVA